MRSYDVTADSQAPPARLWSLLLDARTWPQWSAVDALVPERSQGLSAAGCDDVGAVRAFRTGRVVTGERITELLSERVFRYEDAFNPALHDYSASVELEPAAGGGTSLRWRGTYKTKPVVGVFFEWYLRRFMQKMVDGLASAGSESPGPARLVTTADGGTQGSAPARVLVIDVPDQETRGGNTGAAPRPGSPWSSPDTLPPAVAVTSLLALGADGSRPRPRGRFRGGARPTVSWRAQLRRAIVAGRRCLTLVQMLREPPCGL